MLRMVAFHQYNAGTLDSDIRAGAHRMSTWAACLGVKLQPAQEHGIHRHNDGGDAHEDGPHLWGKEQAPGIGNPSRQGG